MHISTIPRIVLCTLLCISAIPRIVLCSISAYITLYQLHHQKQIHFEDVPSAQKMEFVRSHITGARFKEVSLYVISCFEKYHTEIN